VLQLKWYVKTWWTIIFRPIYFYSKLKAEDWQKHSLTFLLTTGWLLGFFATLVVFILQYVPIGSTLVEGISGLKFVLILPVLLTLIFSFFVITFLILSGAFISVLFVLFQFAALLLHGAFVIMEGKGGLSRMIQSAFYSSAAALVMVLVMLLTLLTKYAGMDFGLFRAGFNAIGFLIILYSYGLLAVAARKIYNVAKWQAFLGSLPPALLLLIFGAIFDKITLSKLQPWIT
jgi:hypothetical protein